jgi:chemosensory pili system protein ChpC
VAQPQIQADIRGVMMTVANGRLLLPNATVAEVITYAEPEPIPGAPAWILGRLRWRGWRLPLISFARLAGLADNEGELGAKVAVLKGLGGVPKVPFTCLLTQGFPRLTTVSEELLLDAPEDTPLRPGVLRNVLLRDDPAMIPDLAGIEAMVAEILHAPEAA